MEFPSHGTKRHGSPRTRPTVPPHETALLNPEGRSARDGWQGDRSGVAVGGNPPQRWPNLAISHPVGGSDEIRTVAASNGPNPAHRAPPMGRTDAFPPNLARYAHPVGRQGTTSPGGTMQAAPP
jgi:hypothetical protein